MSASMSTDSDFTPPTIATNLATSSKRACDACHRRKVKCVADGTRNCKNCTLAGLTCTYNAIPQKKGPKGSRAKVISELRETQRQTQTPPGHLDLDFDTSHGSIIARRPGRISPGLINRCVEFFLAEMYPTQPILHRASISQALARMDVDLEAHCLVLSLCAYMLFQPNMPFAPEGLGSPADGPGTSSRQMGQALLQEVNLLRRSYNLTETPTINSVIISFFLFGSYFCLDKQTTAWYHLREATTLAQMMNMHDEGSYGGSSREEVALRRRLYWLLFITERAYALQHHRPLSLHGTISLPTLDVTSAERPQSEGFLLMIKLYRVFDNAFMDVWNKALPNCSAEWITSVQRRLEEALPSHMTCTESQAADLKCSQLWLHTIVWQLAMSHGLLSSTVTDNVMSFQYPITICRSLTALVAGFSRPSLEVHGVGLVEKLFDIACTLADVISCVPYEQHGQDFAPGIYLDQIATLISTLRGGRERFLPLLMAKMQETAPASISAPARSSSTFGSARLEQQLYDEKHLPPTSATTSGQSSPFGTPPTNYVNYAIYGFHDNNAVYPPTSAPAIVPAGMDYGDSNASGQVDMYHGLYIGNDNVKRFVNLG